MAKTIGTGLAPFSFMAHGALSEDEIDAILEAEHYGHLACAVKDEIYVVPINFVIEGNALYAHSFPGQKVRMMRQNPNVCFQIEHVNSLADWKSVVAWGRFEELAGDERRKASAMLSERLLPQIKLAHGARHPASLDELREVIFFKIVINKRTGRFESPV